jgi:hypothetical protein
MRFDRDEVDAAHGYAHPRFDDDPLVKDAVDDVDVRT